jgi:hypothetical protein
MKTHIYNGNVYNEDAYNEYIINEDIITKEEMQELKWENDYPIGCKVKFYYLNGYESFGYIIAYSNRSSELHGLIIEEDNKVVDTVNKLLNNLKYKSIFYRSINNVTKIL